MGKEKRKLVVSLPCLALVFAVIFIATSVVIWASSLSLVAREWRSSSKEVSLALVSTNAQGVSAVVQRHLVDAGDIVSIVAQAVEHGRIPFDPLNMSSNTEWIELERDTLRADNQFESAYIAYEYTPNSWGFAGWFIIPLGEFFSFTNSTGGHIAVIADATGGVNFSEAFESLPFLNETERQYIQNPLQSSGNTSWTTSHPYISFGQHIVVGGKSMVVGVDLNIAILEDVLATARADLTPDTVVLAVETKTNVLLGSGDQTFSYTNLPDNILLSPSQSTVVVGQAVLEAAGGNLTNLPTSLAWKKSDFYIGVKRFQLGDGEELDWTIIVAVPSSHYDDEVNSSIRKAWGISGAILGGVLLLLLLIVVGVTRYTYIVYQSRYNHERFEDDEPLSPEFPMNTKTASPA